MVRGLAVWVMAWAAVLNAQRAPELKAKVDAAAEQVLKQTGVPSAAVGIVVDGRVVLTAAYGDARIDPPVRRRRR